MVGPTHPFKGGVSQHTTALAHQLSARGHTVEIVSWRSQYPRLLYPGVQHVIGQPELPIVAATRRNLHWARPWTWVREGRRLRDVDMVVVAHVTPIQVPAYWLLLSSARASSARRTTIICHNVLPHEPTVMQRPLVRLLLRHADVVVTHSAPQAALAEELTAAPVATVALPVFGPSSFTSLLTRSPEVHRRLLFFGLVRPYKGLDVLLRALARGPADVTLRVAGEFWGGVELYEDLCRELGVEDRVELLSGYVAAEDVPVLFADADALVLPYRSATGSQGPWTAFDLGLPVIVTDAGSLAEGVSAGVDGLVVPADDVDALAEAINAFYEGGRPLEMRANVRGTDAARMWADYLEALGIPS